MFPGNFRAAMDTYRDVSVGSVVESATAHQLVCMLFDGARAAVAAAKGHLARREIAAKCAAISKALAIIDGGLKVSLDLKVGGPIAQNLYDLYDYMSHRLLAANLNNDSAALDEVAELLRQLGGAWETIAAKPAGARAAAIAPPVAPRAAPPVQPPKQNPAAAAAPAQTAAAALGTSSQPNAIAASGPAQNSGAAAMSPGSQQNRIAAAYGVR